MVALLNNHDNFVLRTFIPSFKKAESDFLPVSKEGSGRGRGRGALRGQRGRRGRGAGPPAKVSTPGTYNLQVGTSYFFNISRLITMMQIQIRTSLIFFSNNSVLQIRDVYPGSRILIFTHPGSRIPDLGSRIPDPKTATKERG